MNTISPLYLVLASSTRWAENSLECNNCLQCICYMQLNTHALLLLSRKSIPDSCSWQHMEGYWLTLVQDLVMRVGFSLGLFQKELCPLGALRYPLGRPQNEHTFNNYLNYLSLTVWAPNSEDWTWLSCFGRHTDSSTHETSVGYWHSRWGAWPWDTICALWPVNPGENTTCWPYHIQHAVVW